jgi:uncharacterized membrane protein
MKKVLKKIKELSFFSTFIAAGIAILVLVNILALLPITLTAIRIILGVVVAIGLTLIIYAGAKDLINLRKNKEWSERKWSLVSICSFVFMIAGIVLLAILPMPASPTPIGRAMFSNIRFIVFFLVNVVGLLFAIYGIYDARKNNKKGELIASIAAVVFGLFTAVGLIVFIISFINPFLPEGSSEKILQLLEKYIGGNR